jgi:hypothetical protein
MESAGALADAKPPFVDSFAGVAYRFSLSGPLTIAL